MIKKIKILMLIFCVFSFFKFLYNELNYKNPYVSKEVSIVAKISNIKKDKEKVTLDVKGKEKYRVTFFGKIDYQLGDTILIKGTLKSNKDNTVFNLFNYNKYLLSKNISKTIWATDISLVKKNNNMFYKIKNNIIKYIENFKTKDYLMAFILGDTGYIKESVKDNLNYIGVSHLLAISGMHVGTIIFLLNFLLSKFKYKQFIIILILLFFVFLTNYSISVLRCVSFIILNKINTNFNLRIKPHYILCFLCFLFLFINPFLIYNIGFLFSFVITFFIIISKNLLMKYKNYFVKLLVMSTICFFASIPILANSFFEINFFSILCNFIVIPIVTVFLFPFSILTFLIPFFDPLLLFFVQIFETLIFYLSQIKILTLTTGKINFIICIIYYLILYFSLVKNFKFIIFLLVLLFLNINLRFFIFSPEIIFFDVGQGDSSLIILPKGKAILVDTGGNIFSDSSIAKNTLIPYLKSRGIKKVESLVLTHGDYDHMGEAINLVNGFEIENVVFNVGEYNDLELELIKELRKRKIAYYQNVRNLKFGKYELYFLNTKNYNNENDNSNVLYFEINNYKFLFMGDSGINREKDIIDKYNLVGIDFIKIGHHGSNTSSSKFFIDNLKPKNCLISVGKNNRYGHPKDSVLEILDNYCSIYRTDLNGSIKIRLKSNKYQIKTIS